MLNWKDAGGNTGLHFASSVGCTDIATAPLETGADPNVVNAIGYTPLDILFTSDPDILLKAIEKDDDSNFRAG
jgi:ankyrin repeat protein